MKQPKVSIIIPLYIITERFFKDLKKFDQLDYPNYEILVVSDKKVDLRHKKAKLVLTRRHRTGPAEKRDIAIRVSKGTICAFIDDDAYPDKNWVKNAVKHFNNKNIAAVGGPGVTPKEDNYWEQITGLVYSSIFCGGFAQHRFIPTKKQLVEDYPAYNLIIRKDVLKEVGGYGSHFYGGEDTFLCLKVINKGYDILYDPGVVVYHHRRALFVPYLRQIANIGIHRGFFAKVFPQTSRRIGYFLPSLLTLGFATSATLSLMNSSIAILFFTLLFFFWLLATISVIHRGTYVMSMLAGIGVILTHLTYGIYFLKGLLTENLHR